MPAPIRFGVLGVLAVIAIGVVFGPQILATGRSTLGDHFKMQAARKFESGDSAGALADIDRALAVSPDDPQSVLLRGICRLQAHDLEGSLADLDRLIEMPSTLPTNERQISEAYRQRSIVYQRLGRHREAIQDATRVVLLGSGDNPAALNHRAYARAIAAGDRSQQAITKEELEEGLKDIDRALSIDGSDEPAFLDTRAYILHLLDRNEEALPDMDKAIEVTQQQKALVEMREDARGPYIQRTLKYLDENLAVMHHHRGLIHQELGNTEEAEQDLKLGKKLGYNPAAGVY